MLPASLAASLPNKEIPCLRCRSWPEVLTYLQSKHNPKAARHKRRCAGTRSERVLFSSVSVSLAGLRVRSNSRVGILSDCFPSAPEMSSFEKQPGDLGGCSDMLLAAPCAVLSADERLRGRLAGGFLFYGLGKNFFEKNAPERVHINLINIFSQAAT